MTACFPGANGKTSVLIVNFLVVVLERPPATGNWCTVNKCEIKGRLVLNTFDPAVYISELDENSLSKVTILVE